MQSLLVVPLQAWGGDIGIEYYSPIAVVFIIIFSILMIGIGIVASRYQTDQTEYFVAGRRGGTVVIALSIFVSIASGWSLIGVPGTLSFTHKSIPELYGISGPHRVDLDVALSW